MGGGGRRDGQLALAVVRRRRAHDGARAAAGPADGQGAGAAGDPARPARLRQSRAARGGDRAVAGVVRGDARLPALPDDLAAGARLRRPVPAARPRRRHRGRRPGAAGAGGRGPLARARPAGRAAHGDAAARAARHRRRRRAGLPDLHEGAARHAAAPPDRGRYPGHRAVDAHHRGRLRGRGPLRGPARAAVIGARVAAHRAHRHPHRGDLTMSQLDLRGLTKRFGAVTALAGADLTVPAGTLTAVLGPSGCGKTTLLRCLAGFERLDDGEILVDGRVVAGPGKHTRPERRHVVTVPQEGALFPHLSVRDNVAFGLTRDERRSGRAEEVLGLVGLAGYGDRMPHHLSGGQQQRVAVARALAPRPSVILLDEPFSALDAGLRADLRRDVRAALRADKATGILVTHDQNEALSVADQVAVMRDGRVLQSGPAVEVYRRPVDPWVAAFVGEA